MPPTHLPPLTTMKAQANLPQYLQLTAYGQRINTILESHEEPVPQWVHSSLIYRQATEIPSKPIAGLEQEGGPDSDNKMEIDSCEYTLDASQDHIFRFAPFVNDPTRIWLSSKEDSDIKSHAPSAQLPSSWHTLDPREAARYGKEPNVQANAPIPELCGIYYYEVKFETELCLRRSAVGLATKQQLASGDPGMYLYHAEDGNILGPRASPKAFGSPMEVGDYLGCGVNFRTNTIFFTKNGFLLGDAFKEVATNLTPVVTCMQADALSTNFGAKEFRYDIVKHVIDDKQKVLDSINSTVGATVSNAKATREIAVLIAGYFDHAGYSLTHEAMLEVIKQLDHESAMAGEPSSAVQESLTQPSDFDLSIGSEEPRHRQLIFDALIDRNITRATELLEEYYPLVLRTSPQLAFTLECLEFARAAASDDVERALSLGRALHENHGSSQDPVVQQTLKSAVALLARPEPVDPSDPVFGDTAHLDLAEKLESAILGSLGLPQVAPLSKFIQDTTDLVEKVTELDPAASLLNLPRDFF